MMLTPFSSKGMIFLAFESDYLELGTCRRVIDLEALLIVSVSCLGVRKMIIVILKL